MWRTPEELVAIGFGRSRVVMMNEFHTDAKLLVWCGNGHHTKEIVHSEFVYREGKLLPKPDHEPDWTPMGYLFQQMSSLDPFTIHQEVRIVIRKTQEGFSDISHEALDEYKVQLEGLGGIAGFLREEFPDAARSGYGRGDAFVFSVQNTLE